MVGDSVYDTTTCTVGDDLILPTPPTKRGYTFQGWQPFYVFLEYIESTGTQWIDTGIKLNAATDDIELVFRANENTEGNSLFGARDSTVAMAYTFAISSDLRYRAGWNNATPTLDLAADTDKHILKIEHIGGVFKLDNTIISISGDSSFVTPTTAGLFAINARSGQGVYYGQTKIYEYKMWRNGELVQHLIPARYTMARIGMYDTVTGTFFENSGTGNFIGGPER